MKYEQCLEEMLEQVFEALVGDNGLKRWTTHPDEGMGGNAIEEIIKEIYRLKDIEYKYENQTKNFVKGESNE